MRSTIPRARLQSPHLGRRTRLSPPADPPETAGLSFSWLAPHKLPQLLSQHLVLLLKVPDGQKQNHNNESVRKPNRRPPMWGKLFHCRLQQSFEQPGELAPKLLRENRVQLVGHVTDIDCRVPPLAGDQHRSP